MTDDERAASYESCALKGKSIDNCLEVSVYVKVSLGISEKCMLSKLLKSAVKAKVEYKTDLLTVHADNMSDLSFSGLLTGTKTTECTKKFTPFKKLEEEALKEEGLQTEEDQNYEYEQGEFLGISQYNIELEAGQTDWIKISVLPDGYELSDVKFESNDEMVAMVSEDGTVLALDTGVTYIRAYIPGTQFEMRCAIIVGQEKIVPFEPIKEL